MPSLANNARPALLLGLVAGLLGCAGHEAALPAHSVTFELCVVGPDGAPTHPPLLSGGDLTGVKAVTRSAWYVLSGRHSTSQVRLTVRPEAMARWQEGLRRAVSRGDRLALVLDDKVLGVMMVQQAPTDPEFAIDAGFFSTGTEKDKARDATDFARKIHGSLP